MRWYKIMRETDDTIQVAHDAVMDIITPLQGQGISSITVNQLIDQLRNSPELSGINITSDLVTQAVSGATGITVAPDTSNGGKLTLSINNDAPSTDAAQKQFDKSEQKVDQAALRQSTKDL